MHTQNTKSSAVLITVGEAAKLAGVSPRCLWNWERARAISCIRIGRVVRFNRETFLDELHRFSTTAVR